MLYDDVGLKIIMNRWLNLVEFRFISLDTCEIHYRVNFDASWMLFLWKFQAKVMSSNWSMYWILHHTAMSSSFVSSFQVKKKQIFKNFTTILLFGVVGIVISYCLISLGKIQNHSSTSTICLFQAWYWYFLKIIQW